MQRECISVHVGQAGIQIGEACWELYCLEHGINPDGSMMSDRKVVDTTFSTFFNETGKGKRVPRALFVDLEEPVVGKLRNGKYRNLYHPNQFVTGKDGGHNNFARGYCGTEAEEMVAPVMEGIRKLVEQCYDLQGFLIFHSLGGGTGSGFSAILMEHLAISYYGKYKIQFAVYPSTQDSTSEVEPYNAILNTHMLENCSDCSLMVENEAIYDICRRNLNIEQPTYTNMNRLIAQVYSSITACLRYYGTPNANLAEFHENLVPFPRVHFPLITYAPFVPAKNRNHEPMSAAELTRACFDPDNHMVKCDPLQGKFLASYLLYRGYDMRHKDVNAAIAHIIKEKRIHFVDWLKKKWQEFKVGMYFPSPSFVFGGDLAKVEQSACMLSNTTAIFEAFARIIHKFDLLHSKRAYVDLYEAEGMPDVEFYNARLTMKGLERDYKEYAAESIQHENEYNFL